MAQLPPKGSWDHDQKTVTTPGTAEQLPSMDVPAGYKLVVEALPTNAGNIFLGNSQANAESTSKRVTKKPDTHISLQVDNANKVWVDAANAGEGVQFFVESTG